MHTPLDTHASTVRHDQIADASVLPLLAAFDAVEHALRRLKAHREVADVPAVPRGDASPPAVLNEALLRVDAAIGDRAGDDLPLQLHALTDALRDLTPAALALPSNFRPSLRD